MIIQLIVMSQKKVKFLGCAKTSSNFGCGLPVLKRIFHPLKKQSTASHVKGQLKKN